LIFYEKLVKINFPDQEDSDEQTREMADEIKQSYQKVLLNQELITTDVVSSSKN
jgi:hypothetical protein